MNCSTWGKYLIFFISNLSYQHNHDSRNRNVHYFISHSPSYCTFNKWNQTIVIIWYFINTIEIPTTVCRNCSLGCCIIHVFCLQRHINILKLSTTFQELFHLRECVYGDMKWILWKNIKEIETFALDEVSGWLMNRKQVALLLLITHNLRARHNNKVTFRITWKYPC